MNTENMNSEEMATTSTTSGTSTTETKKSIYSLIEEEIKSMDISDEAKKRKLKKLAKLKNQQLNVMLVGATGSGKSSTVNALFDMSVAKVGEGVDPETRKVTEFQLDNLTVWDTPGLGDGVDKDQEIADEILLKLQEKDSEGEQLIDLVIMVVDASSKDLGNYYTIINDILIPEFGDLASKKIVIALNQSDIAMKGTHWDSENNKPDDVLETFLKKKAASVRARIKENTGLDLKPVCYCAGYSENGVQRKPYNLTKLLYHIVKAAPKAKRLTIAENLNNDSANWAYNEDVKYSESLKKDFGDIVVDCLGEGMDTGCDIGGDLLGIPGMIVGAVIGGVIGGVAGVIKAIAS
ncbi:GTPase family protein [Butyrivibrio sp. AD3002]|uniref:GTPase family protein n=1 Tax=Butyrivibrio sp. AD3002 TaxID=1280670 RepID=UPI0003B3AD72|nr:GTPase [Butyrivibrio sp. AD3002]